VAVSRGAIVYPYRWRDWSSAAFAESVGAELAGSRREEGYSLSPASLMSIPAGTGVVLPSPNGSTLSMATGGTPTLAGCLRNARAVAHAALGFGPRVAVIPCGERWKEEDSLRPAFEDLIGAGAIIAHLEGRPSPEARAALAAFRDVESRLPEVLAQCASGRELCALGYEHDIEAITELNVDGCAPLLVDGAYRACPDRDG
jgi:2-phosphosulfolactate phosphatase